MCKGLIGRKLGMTSLFAGNGRMLPVTVVEAGPCVVTQVKTLVTDGYNALQLGFGSRKPSRVNKPIKGHIRNSGSEGFAVLREVAVDDPEAYEVGQSVGVDLFSVGERVDVSGTTKGRGFSGVVRRHGFHLGRKTHGSHSYREPGSVGCSAWPAKVIRGKKMPGHYGAARQTARNLEIVDIRPDQNLLLIKGAVPGPGTGLLTIRKLKYARR